MTNPSLGKMMKRTLALIVAIFVMVPPAKAQFESHLYTRPTIPSQQVLDRLDLTLAWVGHVPTTSTEDGISTFQLLTGQDRIELLIQTRSGFLELRDAETGDLKWRTPVGLPRDAPRGAAFNDDSVFITRKSRLYVLNRKTGKHRVFSVDKKGVPTLGFEMIRSTTATPTASGVAVFFPSEGRIATYVIPKFTDDQLNLPTLRPEAFLPPGAKDSPQPELANTAILLGLNIFNPVVVVADRMVALGDDGTLTFLNKYNSKIVDTFKAYAGIVAGIGQQDDMVYFGAQDNTLYAINAISAQLHWRFLAGGTVTRTPQATYRDVFVTVANKGMFRVDRESGRQVWVNRDADKFLAVNEKYVYVMDQRRFLLVLDYLRGTTLAKYDTSDFLIPMSNNLTDRIYLINHDGTVLCMHHRDYRRPFFPGQGPPPKVPPKEKGKEKKAI
jgi:outer membrane protein assembly factor BamB